MLFFKGQFITSGGNLSVQALKHDGEVTAYMSDEFGAWSKSFVDKYAFKKWFNSLSVERVIELSECAC